MNDETESEQHFSDVPVRLEVSAGRYRWVDDTTLVPGG